MDCLRHERYRSSLSDRYASDQISYLFSAQNRITTFRKLWLSLAKAQKKLGLSITDQQIEELKENISSIDFELALQYEKKCKHDVMAHIHAYGDLCPNAKKIIHLGATSCFVTDNADLIIMKEGLTLLFDKLLICIKKLKEFCEKEKGTVCLGFTHYQPAQPTTVGKRAALWLQDFFFDAQEMKHLLNNLPFLGAKGATGTQASFLTLFDHDEKKVEELDRLIASDFGFEKILLLSGQTYTRKIDVQIFHMLASFAASAHKMATDIRLLSHDGELFESFHQDQVGSSAMPFKKNPIYSERICGIARFVSSLAQNGIATLSTQWLERSLDDSSNRRVTLPELFLGTDAILNTLHHLITHLGVNHPKIEENLEKHLPHLIMETILMEAVKMGKDRQEIHESLRKLSQRKKEEMLQELGIDPSILDSKAMAGRASSQVTDFVQSELDPFLQEHHLNSSIPAVQL